MHDNVGSITEVLLNFTVCGGEFSISTYGTISSPGSPGKYPPNRDCYWKLIAPYGKRIQMHFFTMQLEKHETCQFDYLAVSKCMNEFNVNNVTDVY